MEGQRHHGERLVDLPEIDVGGLEPGPLEHAARTAPAGAVVNHSGFWASVAWATMRASGLTPRRAASAAVVSTRAAAPSLILLALPAVTVPSPSGRRGAGSRSWRGRP